MGVVVLLLSAPVEDGQFDFLVNLPLKATLAAGRISTHLNSFVLAKSVKRCLDPVTVQVFADDLGLSNEALLADRVFVFGYAEPPER